MFKSFRNDETIIFYYLFLYHKYCKDEINTFNFLNKVSLRVLFYQEK